MVRLRVRLSVRVMVRLRETGSCVATENMCLQQAVLSILQKMSSVKLVTDDSLEIDSKPDIIVDGILGTGITGEIREPYASAINYINETNCFKFAVDVPSGLDPQTGETANIYTKCDMTVTFHKMKQGIPKRKDLTGEVFVEKIGIPPEAEDGIL